MTDKELVKRCHNLFQRTYNIQSRNEWRSSSEKGYSFFLGNQLTVEEVNELREKKMPTFTVNKMTPQIELMVYFLTARSPRWQAVGYDGTDTEIANLHAKVAQYIWKISKGQTLLSQVVRDSLTKSIGYISVGIDPDKDNGLGEVILESIEPWDVYVDPSSRDPFFDDASWILVSKQKTKEQIMNDLPELSEDKIIKNLGSDAEDNMYVDFSTPTPQHTYDVPETVDSFGEEEEKGRYYELYQRKKIPYVNVFYISTEEQQIQTEQGIQTQTVKVTKNVTMSKSDYDEFKEESAIKDKVIEAIPFNKQVWLRSKVFGNIVIDNEVELPSSYSPIIPLCYRHTGNPYPMSAAMDLVGKQEEINKAHQIMIHHANLSSVPRYLAEEGAISDPAAFEKKASTPGSVLTYNPDSQGNAPTPVQPAQLNSAFYDISRLGVSDMEYISGMSGHMQGQGDYSGREPYRGLLARDDFGTRRIRGFANNVLNEFLSRVGIVADEFARYLYRTEKTIQIVSPDDPESVELFHLNKITGDKIEEFYDEASTNYDITFISGSTLLVNRWAELEEYMNLYQNQIIDGETVLYKTDIPNKKEIIKKIGAIQQLQSSVQQMQAQIEELSKQNKGLEDQLVKSKLQTRIAQAEGEIQAEEEKIIQELKFVIKQAKEQGKNIEKAVNNKLREFELDAKEEKQKNNTNK